MDESVKRGRGGKRAGAGRPRNEFIGKMIKGRDKSRATIYRTIRRASCLQPEALAFGSDPAISSKITGKALDIAGWFETAEQQIEVLKLAIESRAAHRALTHVKAIIHLRDLGY